MNDRIGLAIYNQDRLSDEEFVQNFVARQEQYKIVLNQIKKTMRSGEKQHLVLIGPRGMGKTSLLRRVAIGISQNPELNEKFLPLRFREEQYNILSLADFWSNCIDSLADWCEQNKYDEIAETLDSFAAGKKVHDCNATLEVFNSAWKKIGKQPILLVDNLNLIIDTLKNENWALRNALQSPGGPILIGATTEPLGETKDKKAAFFEFFFPYFLDPLNESEILACMHALANMRKEAGSNVRQILREEPVRIKILHRLTGGNPRVLVLLYRLLENADTTSVFEDLEALLEEVTPYYKSRVEEYTSSVHRAIIDGIALNWDPITPKALSDATGIPATTLPAQLKRLKNNGLIKQVEMSGSSAGYEFVERFFNIWYLMRHGTRRTKQRVKWLVAFFNSFYSPENLAKLADRCRNHGSEMRHGYYYEAVRIAMEDQIRLLNFSSAKMSDATGKPDSQSEELEFHWVKDPRMKTSDTALPFIQEVLDKLSIDDATNNAMETAFAMYKKASLLSKAEETEDAITAYSKIITKFGESGKVKIQVGVAHALNEMAADLMKLNNFDEAISTWGDLLVRYGAVENIDLRVQVASALIGRGGVFWSLGRQQDAIASCDEVLKRFDKSKSISLQEMVALALFNKGTVFNLTGRTEEAVATFDRVIAKFGGSDNVALQNQVTAALISKSVALETIGRTKEAIAVCDEFLTRFGDNNEIVIQKATANCLLNKGQLLGNTGQYDEAITVYNDLFNRFDKNDDIVLQRRVAKSFILKGFALGFLGHDDDEISMYDKLLTRFGEHDDIILRTRVVEAQTGKGLTLGTIGRANEAIAVFDDVLARIDGYENSTLRAHEAWAMFYKGVTLASMGRHKEAIAVYDDLLTRFGGSDNTALQEQVAQALQNKGSSFSVLGRHKEAIGVYNDLLARFRDSDNSNIQKQVVYSLNHLGNHLVYDTTRQGSAEQCFQEAIAIADDKHSSLSLANLSWLYVLEGNFAKAKKAILSNEDLPEVGRLLLDAAIALREDNFGASVEIFSCAIEQEMNITGFDFSEDLHRYLFVAQQQNYGERLLEWFEESGHDKKQAPVYVAFLGFVRGEKYMLDFNKEVRDAAQPIYKWLAGHASFDKKKKTK